MSGTVGNSENKFVFALQETTPSGTNRPKGVFSLRKYQLFLGGFLLEGRHHRIVHDRSTDHDGSVCTDYDTDAESH